MQKWERFFKITKIDKEEQMVYGYASTPDLDSDGEVIKVEALEKALPSYMQFPTIREMHQPVPAGTTKEATITKKGLYIGAKIVKQEAWDLVKEGVYRAFSIGGNVIKRVGNVIQELELVEISLVDVPANKAAVIEVWKRGKVTKDAETAYSMANLMIQVKDLIYWYNYKGKDTTKLTQCLEMIKQMLVVEAQEPEEGSEDDTEVIDTGMFAGATVAELKGKMVILEAMDFSNNPLADIVRKGVILSMGKKIIKAEKAEEEKEVEETQTETTQEDAEDTETETTEEKTEEETETKETGELEATLQKISKTMEKVAPSQKEEKPNTDLAKSVSAMAGSLAKMADVIEGLHERLVKVESTKAAVKSKSTIVLKGQEEVVEDKTKKSNTALEVKKARLAELDKIYDQIGKSEYAKRGHSQEAARLMNEIGQLEIQG